jgi:hypothetical protein
VWSVLEIEVALNARPPLPSEAIPGTAKEMATQRISAWSLRCYATGYRDAAIYDVEVAGWSVITIILWFDDGGAGARNSLWMVLSVIANDVHRLGMCKGKMCR